MIIGKNVKGIVDISFYWNDEEDEFGQETCFIGEYDENTPEVDAFFWFQGKEEITNGDFGDFTVTDYRIWSDAEVENMASAE